MMNGNLETKNISTGNNKMEKTLLNTECILDKDIVQCNYYIEPGKCKNQEQCSFQKTSTTNFPSPQKEKWFEKYYEGKSRPL